MAPCLATRYPKVVKSRRSSAARVGFANATHLLAPLAQSPAMVLTYLNVHDQLAAPVSLDGVRIVYAQPRRAP